MAKHFTQEENNPYCRLKYFMKDDLWVYKVVSLTVVIY